jgi:hypothetical protein
VSTLFLAYAPADRALADAVAAFVERGSEVRVFLQEGELKPGEDLAQKAREGRMADAVLALFSRASLPPRWPRAQWEDALVNEPAAENVRIAFARLDDCLPPRVLSPMFECPQLKGLREVKRWARNRAATWVPPELTIIEEVQTADLDILGVGIADRPGSETVHGAALAFAFAARFREDFDGVYRLQRDGRSITALAGDLAMQLGLRLEGPEETNLKLLGEHCAARRLLLLLDGALGEDPFEFSFGGRCSTLFCEEAGPAAVEPESLHAVQLALARGPDWEETCRLARMARRLSREQGRIAELHEIMRNWRAQAEARQDAAVLNESARELVWILESWDRVEEARQLEYRRAAEFDEQIPLQLPF